MADEIVEYLGAFLVLKLYFFPCVKCENLWLALTKTPQNIFVLTVIDRVNPLVWQNKLW